jgi:hypothetical protein
MKEVSMTRTRSQSAVSTFLVVAFGVSLAGCFRNDDHVSFHSAEAAYAALVEAIEHDDGARLKDLLGPNPEDLLSSGDAVQDKHDRSSFVAAYRKNHRLVVADKDTNTLVIGDDQWPFAIPVSKRKGRWYLDGEKGVDELVYRRIGANELGAIKVCRGFVEAQREYAAQGRDGDSAGIYALKLISDEGMQNGLYWPTSEGAASSPAGPGVAAAAAEGYRRGTRLPYHGYYYRMLYRQSEHANGGAREYFKDGLLTEGFALVAWPAAYQVSGAMSFIVSQDGVVFQKDLGEDTESVVATMNAYDPDSSWALVKDTSGS